MSVVQWDDLVKVQPKLRPHRRIETNSELARD